MIYGSDMLESGITFDYRQLVLDCEIARMIKFVVQGFDVTDESLALDVIEEIGPGGHFLMHQHTFDLMRTQSVPEIIDRKSRGAWESAGAKTAYERATEKAKWILENHEPEPLPDDVLATIRSIVAETEKELGVES